MFRCILLLSSHDRVAALEQEISNLTSESERLARVLEAQKRAGTEVEENLKRSIDQLNKDLSSKVRLYLLPCEHTLKSYQTAEADNLKQALGQYSDYDEIKRELEIMKVRVCNSTSKLVLTMP